MADNNTTQAATHVVDRRVGRLVAGYIASGGYSQRAVANAIGVSGSGLSRRISGHARWNLDELFGIAEFLDIPVTWLFDFDSAEGSRMLGVRASRCTALSLVAA